jgi:hypothetical protein
VLENSVSIWTNYVSPYVEHFRARIHQETHRDGRDDDERYKSFKESLIWAEQKYPSKDHDSEKQSPGD